MHINKVYNLIILDESGSMESIRQATIRGFNELLQSIKSSLKLYPDISQYVSFFSFNGTGIREILPLDDASKLNFLNESNYQPDHMTPLYDAIGIAVNKLRGQLKGQSDYSVLVTILTDGEENVSKEYTFPAIASLISEMKGKGWVFTYIGANHDVEKTAMALNINNHLHFHATEDGMDYAMSTTANSRKRYMDKMSKGEKGVEEGFFE